MSSTVRRILKYNVVYYAVNIERHVILEMMLKAQFIS